MRQTTLGQAIAWVSNRRTGYGFADDEKDEARDVVINIIEEAYEEFPSLQFQNDVEECFCIEEFDVDCMDCNETYRGVTLPYYMSGVVSAWASDGSSVTLHSKWRELHTGLKFNDCYDIKLYEVAGVFPTERDIKGGVDQIGIKSTNPFNWGCDNEVLIKVEYENGEQADIRLPVKEEYVFTEMPVAKIISIVLPLDHKDGIRLIQSRGERLLSEYSPHEHVPSYKRVKINSPCKNKQIFIRSNREFNPREFYWDTDIIPIGSKRVFEEGCRYFKNLEDGTSNAILERAEYHKAKFIQKIQNNMTRSAGRKDDAYYFGDQSIRGGGLPTNY